MHRLPNFLQTTSEKRIISLPQSFNVPKFAIKGAKKKLAETIGTRGAFSLPLIRRHLLWTADENSADRNAVVAHQYLVLTESRSPLTTLQINATIRKHPSVPHDHIARYFTPDRILLNVNGTKVTISGLIKHVAISKSKSNVSLLIERNLFPSTNPFRLLQSLNAEEFDKENCDSRQSSFHQLRCHSKKHIHKPTFAVSPAFSGFTPHEQRLLQDVAFHPKVLSFFISALQRQFNRSYNISSKLSQFSHARDLHIHTFPFHPIPPHPSLLHCNDMEPYYCAPPRHCDYSQTFHLKQFVREKVSPKHGHEVLKSSFDKTQTESATEDILSAPLDHTNILELVHQKKYKNLAAALRDQDKKKQENRHKDRKTIFTSKHAYDHSLFPLPIYPNLHKMDFSNLFHYQENEDEALPTLKFPFHLRHPIPPPQSPLPPHKQTYDFLHPHKFLPFLRRVHELGNISFFPNITKFIAYLDKNTTSSITDFHMPTSSMLRFFVSTPSPTLHPTTIQPVSNNTSPSSIKTDGRTISKLVKSKPTMVKPKILPPAIKSKLKLSPIHPLPPIRAPPFQLYIPFRNLSSLMKIIFSTKLLNKPFRGYTLNGMEHRHLPPPLPAPPQPHAPPPAPRLPYTVRDYLRILANLSKPFYVSLDRYPKAVRKPTSRKTFHVLTRPVPTPSNEKPTTLPLPISSKSISFSLFPSAFPNQTNMTTKLEKTLPTAYAPKTTKSASFATTQAVHPRPKPILSARKPLHRPSHPLLGPPPQIVKLLLGNTSLHIMNTLQQHPIHKPLPLPKHGQLPLPPPPPPDLVALPRLHHFINLTLFDDLRQPYFPSKLKRFYHRVTRKWKFPKKMRIEHAKDYISKFPTTTHVSRFSDSVSTTKTISSTSDFKTPTATTAEEKRMLTTTDFRTVPKYDSREMTLSKIVKPSVAGPMKPPHGPHTHPILPPHLLHIFEHIHGNLTEFLNKPFRGYTLDEMEHRHPPPPLHAPPQPHALPQSHAPPPAPRLPYTVRDYLRILANLSKPFYVSLDRYPKAVRKPTSRKTFHMLTRPVPTPSNEKPTTLPLPISSKSISFSLFPSAFPNQTNMTTKLEKTLPTAYAPKTTKSASFATTQAVHPRPKPILSARKPLHRPSHPLLGPPPQIVKLLLGNTSLHIMNTLQQHPIHKPLPLPKHGQLPLPPPPPPDLVALPRLHHFINLTLFDDLRQPYFPSKLKHFYHRVTRKWKFPQKMRIEHAKDYISKFPTTTHVSRFSDSVSTTKTISSTSDFKTPTATTAEEKRMLTTTDFRTVPKYDSREMTLSKIVKPSVAGPMKPPHGPHTHPILPPHLLHIFEHIHGNLTEFLNKPFRGYTLDEMEHRHPPPPLHAPPQPHAVPQSHAPPPAPRLPYTVRDYLRILANLSKPFYVSLDRYPKAVRKPTSRKTFHMLTRPVPTPSNEKPTTLPLPISSKSISFSLFPSAFPNQTNMTTKLEKTLPTAYAPKTTKSASFATTQAVHPRPKPILSARKPLHRPSHPLLGPPPQIVKLLLGNTSLHIMNTLQQHPIHKPLPLPKHGQLPLPPPPPPDLVALPRLHHFINLTLFDDLRQPYFPSKLKHFYHRVTRKWKFPQKMRIEHAKDYISKFPTTTHVSRFSDSVSTTKTISSTSDFKTPTATTAEEKRMLTTTDFRTVPKYDSREMTLSKIVKPSVAGPMKPPHGPHTHPILPPHLLHIFEHIHGNLTEFLNKPFRGYTLDEMEHRHPPPPLHAPPQPHALPQSHAPPPAPRLPYTVRDYLRILANLSKPFYVSLDRYPKAVRKPTSRKTFHMLTRPVPTPSNEKPTTLPLPISSKSISFSLFPSAFPNQTNMTTKLEKTLPTAYAPKTTKSASFATTQAVHPRPKPILSARKPLHRPSHPLLGPPPQIVKLLLGNTSLHIMNTLQQHPIHKPLPLPKHGQLPLPPPPPPDLVALPRLHHFINLTLFDDLRQPYFPSKLKRFYHRVTRKWKFPQKMRIEHAKDYISKFPTTTHVSRFSDSVSTTKTISSTSDFKTPTATTAEEKRMLTTTDFRTVPKYDSREMTLSKIVKPSVAGPMKPPHGPHTHPILPPHLLHIFEHIHGNLTEFLNKPFRGYTLDEMEHRHPPPPLHALPQPYAPPPAPPLDYNMRNYLRKLANMTEQFQIVEGRYQKQLITPTLQKTFIRPVPRSSNVHSKTAMPISTQSQTPQFVSTFREKASLSTKVEKAFPTIFSLKATTSPFIVKTKFMHPHFMTKLTKPLLSVGKLLPKPPNPIIGPPPPPQIVKLLLGNTSLHIMNTLQQHPIHKPLPLPKHGQLPLPPPPPPDLVALPRLHHFINLTLFDDLRQPYFPSKLKRFYHRVTNKWKFPQKIQNEHAKDYISKFPTTTHVSRFSDSVSTTKTISSTSDFKTPTATTAEEKWVHKTTDFRTVPKYDSRKMTLSKIVKPSVAGPMKPPHGPHTHPILPPHLLHIFEHIHRNLSELFNKPFINDVLDEEMKGNSPFLVPRFHSAPHLLSPRPLMAKMSSAVVTELQDNPLPKHKPVSSMFKSILPAEKTQFFSEKPLSNLQKRIKVIDRKMDNLRQRKEKLVRKYVADIGLKNLWKQNASNVNVRVKMINASDSFSNVLPSKSNHKTYHSPSNVNIHEQLPSLFLDNSPPPKPPLMHNPHLRFPNPIMPEKSDHDFDELPPFLQQYVKVESNTTYLKIPLKELMRKHLFQARPGPKFGKNDRSTVQSDSVLVDARLDNARNFSANNCSSKTQTKLPRQSNKASQNTATKPKNFIKDKSTAGIVRSIISSHSELIPTNSYDVAMLHGILKSIQIKLPKFSPHASSVPYPQAQIQFFAPVVFSQPQSPQVYGSQAFSTLKPGLPPKSFSPLTTKPIPLNFNNMFVPNLINIHSLLDSFKPKQERFLEHNETNIANSSENVNISVPEDIYDRSKRQANGSFEENKNTSKLIKEISSNTRYPRKRDLSRVAATLHKESNEETRTASNGKNETSIYKKEAAFVITSNPIRTKAISSIDCSQVCL